MNRTLMNRIRVVRPAPARTSWDRRAGLADGHRSSIGHGSRMPSQRATTRMQRPY